MLRRVTKNGSGNMNIYILIIYRRGNEISVHFLPRMHIRNICGFGDKNAYIRGIIYSEGKKGIFRHKKDGLNPYTDKYG